MNERPIELADVEAARARIQGLAVVTPARHSVGLSRLLDARTSLKLESMQPTGAFKLRGAANAILSLSDEARQRGVFTQSSGNHGRAVAYVASQLGIPAVICLSRRTPKEKVEAVRMLDVEVVVKGGDQMEAMDVALSLARERELTLIPPFDDRHIIAGQGTIGVELVEQCPELETIIVPLSGGGLASGVAMAAKSLRPDLRVVGVSQDKGAAMYESLQAGRLVEVEEEPSWADALVGGLPSDNRWTIDMCRRWLDDIRLVTEDEIATAMVYALRHEHIVLEGGAAVGLALLLAHPREGWGGNVAVICTGDNVGIDRLLALERGRDPSAP
jgi:threonine dehydratase